jgi:hypothetical protein
MKMTSPLRKALFLGCCAIVGAAFAQQTNPLIGEWKGVIRDASNYSMAFDFIYYPNNTFAQTIAVPPNRETGMGSGIVSSRGQYRMISDHSVELNEQERKMCLAGDMSNCAPIPAGGLQTFSFRMEGADKLINTDNGQVTYRVR